MEDISKELRKMALLLSNKCQDGNLQSVFSCLDVLWVVYDKIMNWSPEIATDESRDYFIISKGQATLALYPILIKKGMFDMGEIMSEIGSFNSRYCIQTDLTKFDGGIENNAGSLGHGFPFATGIAFANKVKGIDNMTFALCGDGELCEGTIWEACLFASDKKLDNLCMIVDDNDSVGAMIDFGDLSRKLDAFGFDVSVVDGHNMSSIESTLKDLISVKDGRPKALIARTIRGYGSKTMTENDIWFHKWPNSDELDLLIKEVEDFEKSIS